MADKFSPITFRPNAASLAAIEKIRNANVAEHLSFTQTNAIQLALIEYAKTLPDVPKEQAPMEKA